MNGNTSLENKQPVLNVDQLVKHYSIRKPFRDPVKVKALNGVSFELYPNETLAVVGESGCGKSTLAKTLLGFEKKTNGEVFLENRSIDQLSESKIRTTVQMIFQDPYGSLNPRKKVWPVSYTHLTLPTIYSV